MKIKKSHGYIPCGHKRCHGKKCENSLRQPPPEKTIPIEESYKLTFPDKIQDLSVLIDKRPPNQVKPHFVRKSFIEQWEPGQVYLVKHKKMVDLNSKKFGRADNFYHSEEKGLDADQIVCAVEKIT